jgi:Zinc-finger double-stranded RNA-binding.
MAKKVFCDGCGKEIVPPTPYTARFRTDVEYQGRDGAIKYRKVFRTFDFCCSECFLKGVTAMVNVAEKPTVEEKNEHQEKPDETEGAIFKCLHCGRTFKKASALKAHISLTKHPVPQLS